MGWYLYRVDSPTGTAADHNYVTVAVYANFEALENPYPNELLSKIVPAQSLPEFLKKTNAARDLVRSGNVATLREPARSSTRQTSALPDGRVP